MSEFESIATAPFNTDLELCLGSGHRRAPLALLRRRSEQGWILPATGDSVVIEPTYWRRAEPLFANLDRRAVASA
jgi:hypothetical protein